MDLPVSQSFQIFVKPAGAVCNLACSYCYYRDKVLDGTSPLKMSGRVLEAYIRQHIETTPDSVVFFSWHGGEPLMAGLDYFKEIVQLQQANLARGKTILNGVQTNGTLLDPDWCEFFQEQGFVVGISLDGPCPLHDAFRKTAGDKPSFDQVLKGYRLLQEYGISTEILCVVHALNVRHPETVYDFFRSLNVKYITFLPLVKHCPEVPGLVTPDSLPPKAFGDFLIKIFELWKSEDIGRIKVQIIEETLRVAFGQEHSLCVFRPECGRIPVIEHTGDFFACDHYVDSTHRWGNIMETHLAVLLESDAQSSFGKAKRDTLPVHCLNCSVLEMCNGGCPKDRFAYSPSGEPGVNYLCEGYYQFFTHLLPFVQQVARAFRERNS